MKRNFLTVLGVCFCAALMVSAANARRVQKDAPQFMRATGAKAPVSTSGNASFNAVAVANTTYLATYKFNAGASCISEGWVSQDITAQTGDYVHVDDFAGLAGGTFGGLNPLAGGKSLWIGARPNAADSYLCGYASLPGYGNGWQQIFRSKCFALTGDATLSYLAAFDSEPSYDFTFVEYDAGCADVWTAFAGVNAGSGSYTGQGTASESLTLTAAEHGGSARIRFNFTSDTAWSDGDGLWDTDGAFIVDNLKITDGAGTQTDQTFEAELVGAQSTVDGHWSSSNLPGYGDFAALLPGAAQLQEDPCARDLSCLWTFFTGSVANYACGGFPGVTAIPYGNADGQYLTNEIWSPYIPWVGAGTQAQLQFAVYRDLPLDNLVFYVWQVRSIVGGCPQAWLNDNLVNFGEDKDWLESINEFGGLVDAAATDIQISLGAWDMCGIWCGTVGSGACHSQSPMIDNVRVKRIDVDGPQWQINSFRLFSDNFAADGTVTGTVRADMGQDLLPSTNLSILPGDSAAATVLDPVNGLAIDPISGTGPAVYAYVKVSPPQPAKTGAALTDNAGRWPVVGSILDPNGDTWYCVRFDTAYTQNNATPSPDNYCVDLNDNLFTPGDTVEYFFCAQSGNGSKSYFFNQRRQYDDADGSGAQQTSTNINVAFANAMEFTCLPAAALNNGGDILYVDDGDGRAVQPYFDQAFQALGILDKVDRFDVMAPSSNNGNSPGSRVTNVANQILPYYKKIIWNSEELEDGTIADGTGSPDKADDFALLFAFLDQSDKDPGLYISGDGIPNDWITSPAPSAVNLRSAYLSFNVVTADHKTVGLGINPRAIGVPGGCFSSVTGPDTMVVYGGCLGINKFDVLTPTGSAVAEMLYNNNAAYAATISQQTLNGSGKTARVMMEGFSYDLIRDDRPGANGGVMDRIDHLYDVITWLQNTVDSPTDVGPRAYRTSLAQNYPNPFNPSTTIEFTVRDRSQVSLKVYNVAGELVRTLVNGERAPGSVHRVAWDGRNDTGQSVSSGIYFYKLVTNDMTQTKKMVLLK
ncbi:MAG TPA: FlgD immunoglobulin-like domain containing protein [Candidatus Krumholzibacteria bacterium]|nr:FlgD immunoglobulin-like domain containing protein [Candidatus Krumholzibacteria bacterium]